MPEPIQPATDEQIAAWEKYMPTNIRNGWTVDAEYLAAAVARVRQAEAEAARLREQVAAMQAADAGAFW